MPHPLPEVNILMVEIPTPKPYIFMIRVTRQIKCLITQVLGVIPHPLPEVNFLMVEIPTPKPYILMIRVTRQIKCIIAQAPGGSYPTPYLK
jgi:hypothetical protein